MSSDEVLIGVVLEDACLTLEQFSCVCAVRSDWVIERVREGHLAASDEAPAAWRFGSRDLARARQLLRIERDFDAVPELAALVADLVEELEDLRARLRCAGLD
jgi:chaperone modulatory protein CbpM